MNSILNFLKKQKKRNILIFLAVVIFLIFIFFNRDNSQENQFVEVTRKDIVQEVSLTGKVRPAQSVDLTFERAGIVSNVLVSVGESVQAGKVLAQLNAQDAQRQLRDAQLNLENARLSFEKTSLQQLQQQRGDALNKSYESGMETLASMYDHIDGIIKSSVDVFFEDDFRADEYNIEYYASQSSGFEGTASQLKGLETQVKDLHRESIDKYKVAQLGNDNNKKAAMQSGYEFAIKTSEMLKVGRDLIRYFNDFVIDKNATHDYQDLINSHIAKLTNFSQTVDSYVQSLSSVINAINTQQDSLDNYSFDSRSRELQVKQAENTVLIASNNLAKYSIYSPFDAVITKNNLKLGGNILANTPVISVISESQFEIESFVPEADIAKIKIGQEATVTLDAFSRDVEFSAKVVSIDLQETIIEGVATYKTILQFSDKDERIKSGMTANIDIMTDSKLGVVSVLQRNLIRKDNGFFANVLQGGEIIEIPVQVGLRGSDGLVEIVSGLKEGDKIVNPS